jgi:hypothetical protein
LSAFHLSMMFSVYMRSFFIQKPERKEIGDLVIKTETTEKEYVCMYSMYKKEHGIEPCSKFVIIAILKLCCGYWYHCNIPVTVESLLYLLKYRKKKKHLKTNPNVPTVRTITTT